MNTKEQETFEKVAAIVGAEMNTFWAAVMRRLIEGDPAATAQLGLAADELAIFARQLGGADLSIDFMCRELKGGRWKCWATDLAPGKSSPHGALVEGSISIGVGIKF